jgi:hypothetical protein
LCHFYSAEINSELLKTNENLPMDVLKVSYLEHIPLQLAPSASFLESYPDEKLAIALCACLAMWAASKKNIVPKEFQLKATVAIMSGKDALIDVGTGYGKTLCMIIPCLLDSPGSIYIIISPLKHLQAVQVLEFEQYGIKTVAINQDTPNDPELWKVRYLARLWGYILTVYVPGHLRRQVPSPYCSAGTTVYDGWPLTSSCVVL